MERAGQFEAGTRLDRWLFSILHSIWLNEIRSRRVREGQGFVDADETLGVDGARQAETHILASQVLEQVQASPEAQRSAVFLAYVEGLSYREVAAVLGRADRHRHEPACGRPCKAGGRKWGIRSHAAHGWGADMSERENDKPLNDEMLVAYIDGELSDTERAEVEAVINGDRRAAARLDHLARSRLPFREAFEPLLSAAPTEKLDRDAVFHSAGKRSAKRSSDVAAFSRLPPSWLRASRSIAPSSVFPAGSPNRTRARSGAPWWRSISRFIRATP